ncbi:serine hydrolase [Singulisphaera rosea]
MTSSLKSWSLNRCALVILGATLLGSGSASGQTGVVGIAYPANGITIDGNLGDWPKGLQAFPIDRVEYGDRLGGDRDLKAHFRLAYNPGEHALYVAVEVDDDSTILDGPGESRWDGRDGCEVFLNVLHDNSGSPFTQYSRYGGHNRVVGPPGVSESSVKVAVVREDSRLLYEWRIEVASELDPDRVIGFDIAVADKDADGSFSWAAWGRGPQKINMPNRLVSHSALRGEFLLVNPGTQFGEATGSVAWKDPWSAALPTRVRIQSSRHGALWRTAIVDPKGTYKADHLPVGPYTIHSVDSAGLRVEEEPHVDITVEAAQTARADLLPVTPIPWPGLIGTGGVLRGGGPFNPAKFDRFVKTYLDYYKIPGISVAVIKDFKVIYHHGFGVKNTTTREPVTDDTVFEAASMTKPVLSYMVLRLVDRGVLDLETPLYTYLPCEDLAHDDRHKRITARMVLTHRTGLPNWRSGKLGFKVMPGSEFTYSGEGFVYLGKVVEHVTGKTLVDLCREEVFAPLGIENASLVWDEGVARLAATGHNGTTPLQTIKWDDPNMAASLHVDAKNYARFLIAVLEGKGLAAATSKEMLRNQQVTIPSRPRTSLGLGIVIEETPLGVNYGHSGENPGFTSRSVLYPDQRIGYVLLVNNYDVEKFDKVLSAYLVEGKSALKDDH